MILPLALMALMVLAAQAATLLALGSSDVQIAANHLRATQALFLAEAGIEDAFNALRPSGALASAPAGLSPLPGLAGPGPTLATFGSYDVLYQSAGVNTVRVVATGTLQHGSKKILRATFTTQFAATTAVLANGALTVEGTSRILGRCGALHANGMLQLVGDLVEVQTGVQASGAASGTYRAPASSGTLAPISDQPRVSMPSVRASRLLAAAESDAVASAALYQLTGEGAVLRWNPLSRAFEPLEDQTTPDTSRTVLRGSGPGWEWSRTAPDLPAQWWLRDDSAPTGTFYVEGDIVITGNPGNASVVAPPWTATLIAADTQAPGAPVRGGNVVVSGNPRITAHFPDIVLAADRDIQIAGSPSSGTYAGLLMAHEQIEVAGNALITGALVAEDAEALSATVTGPGSRVSGSATITYDCSAVAPLEGPLTILAWGS